MNRRQAEDALREVAECIGIEWRTLPLGDREAAVDALLAAVRDVRATDEEGA